MKSRLQHWLRIGLFVATLVLIHLQHQRSVERAALRVEDWSDLMPLITGIVPEAVAVTSSSEVTGGLRQLVDMQGQTVGLVAKTLPSADHIVGFSGPTDVLMVFDTEQRLLACRIISSRDTRDHVRQIAADRMFLNFFRGHSADELQALTEVDAVSGATLTSLAIVEAIRHRLLLQDPGANPSGPAAPALVSSLRFSDPPAMTAIRILFPSAADVVRQVGQNQLWSVNDQSGAAVGSVLRTSPAADNVVGYQGPTDTLVGLNLADEVIGIVVGRSYDNEPYTDYVREDDYFRSLFNGMKLQAVADPDVSAKRIEGVSGATMTSMAVVDGVRRAAARAVEEQRAEADRQELTALASASTASSGLIRQAMDVARSVATWRNLSTVGMALLGTAIGVTHLRRHRWLRIGFQIAIIIWLGFINGDMVSQAVLLGWTQHGVPWQSAFGLMCLCAVAFLVPVTSGHNVYCSHICPHGAVQQLLRNRLPWKLRLSSSVQRALKLFPVVLLVWVVAIALLRLPFSAVDVEPFDAWLWSIAGPATISVAIIGLVASLFVPMAYCRFGCPTGALLEHVRSRSAYSFGSRDIASILLFAAAVAAWYL